MGADGNVADLVRVHDLEVLSVPNRARTSRSFRPADRTAGIRVDDDRHGKGRNGREGRDGTYAADRSSSNWRNQLVSGFQLAKMRLTIDFKDLGRHQEETHATGCAGFLSWRRASSRRVRRRRPLAFEKRCRRAPTTRWRVSARLLGPARAQPPGRARPRATRTCTRVLATARHDVHDF